VRLVTAAAGVAAGSYYVPLEFTNTSGRPCRLAGYPAVAFTTGAAGQQIGTAAAADHAVPAHPVLLAPGATAHAWLQFLSTAAYPASKCHPVTAAGLRVVAPGSQSASYVAHPVPACRAVIRGSKILTVHPVQQGKARRGTA
jgi:S1-C subfamily serine protease